MTAKDTIFEFINLIFLVLLIGFCIFFFLNGDRFAAFTVLLKSLTPVALFGIILLIKNRFNRQQVRKRQEENNMDITLRLTYFDRLKTDFVVFSLPMIVLLIPIIFVRKIDALDLLQASAAFAIFYFWQKFLFKKEY